MYVSTALCFTEQENKNTGEPRTYRIDRKISPKGRHITARSTASISPTFSRLSLISPRTLPGISDNSPNTMLGDKHIYAACCLLFAVYLACVYICMAYTCCIYIIKIKIHSSCEIEDFVETHLCKLCVILRSRALRVVCPH